MSKTYSELRQTTLFKAARDMRRIAAMVLNDVTEVNQGHQQSLATFVWAKQLAAKTARQANDLEQQGHEECIASNYAEAVQRKNRAAYSDAITLFSYAASAAGYDLDAEIERLNQPIAVHKIGR